LKLVSRVKVIDGSAVRGEAVNFMPRNSIWPSTDMRFLTFSCATIAAPAPPKFSLPPVWSKCQCVFTRYFTGFGDSLAIASLILGVSGANWSSTITTASGPIDRPILPPAPVSM
jgi:hypothetical protein